MADLLSVLTVAEHIGLADQDADYNLVNRLIDAAKSAFEAQCHRSLDLNTQRTEYHNGGGQWIHTNQSPITAVSHLSDSNQSSARTIASTDWITDSNDGGENYRSGMVELWNQESHFAGSRLDVKITYNAGWTATTLPDDILQGWILCVAYWYNNRDNPGIISMSADGQTVNWQQGEVPEESRLAWAKYSLARNS